MNGRCSSCGREVLWGRTEAGKRMPLDSRPHDDGNIVMSELDAAGTPLLRVIKKVDRDAYRGVLYKSHFATCPNALAHRRRHA